jgi:eukaryotic-like serine/threonine-protein kinase
MPAAPLTATDPTSVDGYKLLGRLGAGGMGTVYLAKDLKDTAGEAVAIKVLHPPLAADPQFLARFASEAAAAARVAGFCTAKVLHADVSASPPYLVTEYVPGPTLDDVLAGGPLPASDVEALAVGVAAALTAIHAAGLTHRDLKPSNVLLSRIGPKVIDFGIARALNSNGDRTESGMLFGTLGWLAPEQLYGQSTQASDVFVWGLLIARAGTGWRPAPELRVSVPAAADLKALPATLAGTVTAALNMDPAHRPSARALLLRLCGSAEAGPVRTATKVLSRPWATPYPTLLGPPSTLLGPPGGHPYPTPPAYPAMVPYPPPRSGQLPVHVPRPKAPPRRRRRWYARKRFLLPIALVVILVVLASNDDGRKEPQLPAGTARDGILEFTVTGWECGKQSLGKPPAVHQTQGQLCTVALRARNFGDEPRRVHVSSQKLRDAAGRTSNADGGAWIYLEQARPLFNHEVNPGNELAGTLVFEIAKDATPQQLEVHDSPLSGGAKLALP